MDFNKFIEQAKPLFQWYRILSSKEITVVDNNRCEYVAIAGEYLLNRSYNNEIYNRIYYLVIILDKTGRFSVPIVWLPHEERPQSFMHMYSDKTCCLGLNHEVLSIWGQDQSAESFFDKILDPYLMNLLSYSRTGKCVTPERPHSVLGVVDYYKKIFDCDEEHVIPFLRYLSKKVYRNELPKGHIMCPCGSGMNLRKCHGRLIQIFISQLYGFAGLKSAFLEDVRSVGISYEKGNQRYKKG